MPTRAILIQNPAAGQGDWQEIVNAAEQTLREAGWEVTRRETTGQGDATTFAREAVADQIDVVVVAGGDGTVNEALQGLAGQRHTALAVIPGGTVNVWAKELGSGDDAGAVATKIVQGQRRAIDVGNVNDRYFLMMVSAGFDAEASAKVSETPELKQVKRHAGPVAYALAALSTLRNIRGHRLTITIDGQIIQRKALMVVVGNTRLYGGIAEITDQAIADDGLLDLCVLSGQSPLDLVRRAAAVVLRRKRQDPDIDYRKATQITLDAPRPLYLQADGEDIGQTPATIQIKPAALEAIIFPDTLPTFLQAHPDNAPTTEQEAAGA